MLMVFVGYGVVVLTVLSISAIATSSTVEGGGVYCILSVQDLVYLYSAKCIVFTHTLYNMCVFHPSTA